MYAMQISVIQILPVSYLNCYPVTIRITDYSNIQLVHYYDMTFIWNKKTVTQMVMV